jgi:DNA-binding transcriptional LysR family regulator
MMPPPIAWDLYRSFLAVTRYGSLSAAARALGLTQPTLGRHIAELEGATATPLFTRSPSGLLPTETALAMLPLAEAMESAAGALARLGSAPGEAVAGTIRFTASEVIGAEVLPPILAAFADTHPGIAFELHLSNRTENLLRRDADIAVRMVRPEQTGLVAQRLGETMLGLYAHASYLAGRPAPRSLAELAAHRLIGYDRNPAQAALAAGFGLAETIFALRTDSDLAQLASLRAGYGLGICQTGIARRDADLIRVLPALIALPLETWLVMHEDLRRGARFRAVFAHVAAGLKAYLAVSN